MNFQDNPRELINKVPQVTTFFWIIKVLSTTVGETFADYLNENLGFGLTGTSLVMSVLLIAALVAQFKVKSYKPISYWLVVVLMSITGTLLTDNLTDNLGISLIASTIVFAILLTITFLIWFKREQTLSIKTVNSPSREGFYWLTILFTFALGTSAGDLFAEKFGIGFGNSFLIFIALILVITSLWRFKKLSEVSAFWACYILTRPLGASSGDFLSQAKKDGGLGLGASTTSWIYLAAILAIVGYLAVTKVDQIKN